MKFVTFIKDELPYRAGEKKLIPDDLAAILIQRGIVAPDPPGRPGATEPEIVTKPMTPEPPSPRRERRQSYLTK